MAETKGPTAADVKAAYGFVALLGKAIPEIGKLLKQAVKDKWTPDRFQMAIVNTKWWKQTPEEKRQWVTQKITDPASAAQDLRVGGDDFRKRAAVLGLGNIGYGASREAWLHAKLHDLSEEQVNSYLFSKAKLGSDLNRMTSAGGRYGELLQEMGEIAYQYGYVQSRDWKSNPRALATVVNHADKVMRSGGTGNSVEWQAKMKKYAASKYAAFADRINGGETVWDIASPYQQAIGEILELNPDDVGLEDSLMKKALQGRSVEGKPPAAMAVWQLEQEARKDKRWTKTNNAKSAAASYLDEIGKAFGMVAS